MDYNQLVTTRHSCRKYDKTRKVDKDLILKCIDIARNSPSACNSQPWHFSLVTNDELVAKVSKNTQRLGINKFTEEASAFVVVEEIKAKLFSELLGSQHYAQMDIGMIVAHLALALYDNGIGCCILGVFDEKKLKEMLSIDSKSTIRLVIAIGYSREETVPTKKRKDLSDCVRVIE